MRNISVGGPGRAEGCIFQQLSAGSPRVLAGVYLHGIEPGSAATTNTLHKGR